MDQPVGRREKNKAEKHARILAAASELFRSNGFNEVTTAQISEMADIAQGTLFRYAATKAELLLMVYNQSFQDAIEQGKQGTSKDLPGRIMDFMKPLIVLAGQRLDNSAIYQRELLFGDMTEPNRREGLYLVTQMESALEQVLLEALEVEPGSIEPLTDHKDGERDSPKAAAGRASLKDPDDAYRMAHALFSQFYVACANAALRDRPVEEALSELSDQVNIILGGWPPRLAR